jgi:hypothetical protein
VQKLVKEHAGKPEGELEKLIEKRVDAVTKGKVFEAAQAKAFAELEDKPKVRAALRKLNEAIGKSRDLTDAMHDVAKKRLTDAEIAKRLRAANRGKHPDQARATELLLDSAFSVERLAAFYVDLSKQPALKRELGKGVRKLLEAPSFRAHVVAALKACIDDVTVRERIVALYGTFLAADPKEADLLASVRGLLGLPVVETAVAGLIEAMLADAALAPIGREVIANVVADQGTRAAIGRLVADW